MLLGMGGIADLLLPQDRVTAGAKPNAVLSHNWVLMTLWSTAPLYWTLMHPSTVTESLSIVIKSVIGIIENLACHF